MDITFLDYCVPAAWVSVFWWRLWTGIMHIFLGVLNVFDIAAFVHVGIAIAIITSKEFVLGGKGITTVPRTAQTVSLLVLCVDDAISVATGNSYKTIFWASWLR